MRVGCGMVHCHWGAAFKIGIGSLWVLGIVEVREAVVCISMEDIDK